MNKPIKKIVIVGGGTAGWMAASAISTVLKPMGLDITLVESEAIPTVGVGEATIPQIQLFNTLLGLDEDEFVRRTAATFKLGIEFVDWGQKGQSYIHPFGTYGFDMGGIHFHHYWLKGLEHGETHPLGDYCLQVYGAKAGKFIRPQNIQNSPLAGITYAFQFDATLYAKFLREFSEANGVKRIEGRITQVNQKHDGFIRSVSLEDGSEIDGEFFIDCSGFRGLLIGDALGNGYEDWSKYLPVNRAVAVACENSEDPVPYTRATARDAGWQWRIPLQHRLGNGYVYCDEYLTPEQAETDLMGSLEGKPLSAPKHLRFTTGHRDKFWDKNCLALGLAAGFMEPLESTSIHMVQTGLSRLMSMFPDTRFNQSDQDHYNRRTVDEYKQVRDFLVLHYKVTQRGDTPFWVRMRDLEIPDSLREKIDVFKTSGRTFREDNELFNETSWLAVMQGQGLKPEGYHPVAHVLSEEELIGRLREIRATVLNSEKTMPRHIDFIRANCPADPAVTEFMQKKMHTSLDG